MLSEAGLACPSEDARLRRACLAKQCVEAGGAGGNRLRPHPTDRRRGRSAGRKGPRPLLSRAATSCPGTRAPGPQTRAPGRRLALGPSAGGERCLFPRLFQMRETRPLRREEEKCIHQTVMIAVKLQLLKEPHGQTVPLHPEQQPGAARTPASRARLTARQERAARSLPGPPPPPSLAGLSPAPLPSPAHPPCSAWLRKLRLWSKVARRQGQPRGETPALWALTLCLFLCVSHAPALPALQWFMGFLKHPGV